MQGNSATNSAVLPKLMSARKPRARENTAPQTPPSNMPTATAAAGTNMARTPKMEMFENSASCTSSTSDI